MPAKRKRDQPIGVGLTAKQMKRRKPINTELMRDIDPLTENQEKLFDSYANDKNLVAYGAAGTGKTFITLYNALREVLDERSPYDKIYIVLTLVAIREIGEVYDKLKKSHPGWNDVLNKCSKAPGSTVKPV